jgi:hypothetical protein
MPPLALTDDEYAAVMQAAGLIHPQQRDAFLKALAVELERYPLVGPGVVFRAASELQRRFVVQARTETGLAAPRERQAAR